jgi:hypothetical protein
MTDPVPVKHELLCACPHCGGPLRVTPEVAECEVGHRFTPVQVQLEQARASARAVWQAVRALEERAMISRSMAADPDLYRFEDPQVLEESSRSDEEVATVLRRYAEAIDRTVGGEDAGRAQLA